VDGELCYSQGDIEGTGETLALSGEKGRVCVAYRLAD
jgi:hypothetical protein